MPLVEKCKALGRAMRIGTNHGSLSARILSYYGDTPRGMVESAFEFADICRSVDYHNFLFSMKASNPLVMVQARVPFASGWPARQPVCLSALQVKLCDASLHQNFVTSPSPQSVSLGSHSTWELSNRT